MERVRISSPDKAFDGKTGTVESRDGGKATVMVDFDDKHKVRNTFNEDCLEAITNEDLNAEETSIDHYMTEALALAEYLDIDPVYLEEDGDYGYDHGYEFKVSYDSEEHGGEEWTVYCDWSDVQLDVRERILNLVDDLGPAEMFEDYCDFIDESYLEDWMRDGVEYDVSEMDREDLIDKMEQYSLISDDDKEAIDPDDPDETDYPDDVLERHKDELVDSICADHGGFDDIVTWYTEMYGWDDLRQMVNQRPDIIDVDRMVDYHLDEFDAGNELACYDSHEREIDYEGTTYYLFRQQ